MWFIAFSYFIFYRLRCHKSLRVAFVKTVDVGKNNQTVSLAKHGNDRREHIVIAAVRHIIDGYDYAMSKGRDEVAISEAPF